MHGRSSNSMVFKRSAPRRDEEHWHSLVHHYNFGEAKKKWKGLMLLVSAAHSFHSPAMYDY